MHAATAGPASNSQACLGVCWIECSHYLPHKWMWYTIQLSMNQVTPCQINHTSTFIYHFNVLKISIVARLSVQASRCFHYTASQDRHSIEPQGQLKTPVPLLQKCFCHNRRSGYRMRCLSSECSAEIGNWKRTQRRSLCGRLPTISVVCLEIALLVWLIQVLQSRKCTEISQAQQTE